MNLKKIIPILALVLVIYNCVGIYSFNLEYTRVIKLISTLVLFIVFLLFKGYKKRNFLVAYICFVMADGFMLFYEEFFFDKLTLLMIGLAYISISIYVYPKINFLSLNKYVILVLLFLVIINLYLYFEILNLINIAHKNILQNIVMVVFGISVVTMGLFASIYNYKYNSIQSVYYILFVFMLILSMIFNAIAYYGGVKIFFYLNRSFHVLALSTMLLYCILPFKKEYRGGQIK
ncbi:hypothetical protein [Pontimicrobium sp. MEBiC01747]